MALQRLLGFLRRSEGGGSSSGTADDGAIFERLHHTFKLFLTEWNNFQETMTQVEYTLCCDHPFGMQRVRKLCTAAATQVFQCIQQLGKLYPAPCEALYARFAELQKTVASVVYEPRFQAVGPRVLPFGHSEGLPAYAKVVEMLSLNAGEEGGFVVTLAGCRYFLLVNDLQGEVIRRIQAAGGPVRARLTKLSQSLVDLVGNAPIPEELALEINAEFSRVRVAAPRRAFLPCLCLWSLAEGEQPSAGWTERNGPGTRPAGLAFRGRPIPPGAPEDAALVAFRETLAHAHRREALVYKRAHGLTESSVGLSVVFLSLPEDHDFQRDGIPVSGRFPEGDDGDESKDDRDHMLGSPVFRILQHAAAHILPLTLEVDSVDFAARNCSTYHDIARYCHEKAISSMFAVGSGGRHAHKRVKQLKDTVLKQFWVVNLNDGFASVPSGPVIDISEIVSLPMLALWRGMNVYPWQGPPPVDGKGFMAVLFEASANPNLDPAAQTAYFSEKNYFMIARNYCSLHSRFGFHFVSVEARLGERKRENYLVFQLRGGAADIERRILRVRFVAELLWEFGFKPQVHNDAVSARLEGMSLEDGEHLLAVAGYMTIHTRQLDMIMQEAARVAARRKEMLGHCRALFTGRDIPGRHEKT
ncbi:MAG: PEP/pyruvate-binding domain-containing protein [Desulfovibrio sp.]|jgi:hypothetical protein|nr:PEP/pyruvate-binding domain-containing protein [Desulfovibrio sp.]